MKCKFCGDEVWNEKQCQNCGAKVTSAPTTFKLIDTKQRKIVLPALIIFIVCLVIGIAAPLVYTTINRSAKYYVGVEAIISQIEHTETEQGVSHTVYVDYTVGGVEYTHVKLDEYNSKMKEGKAITIYYNINNPTNIRFHKNASIWWLILGIGLPAIGIIVNIEHIVSFVRYKRNKKSLFDDVQTKKYLAIIYEIGECHDLKVASQDYKKFFCMYRQDKNVQGIVSSFPFIFKNQCKVGDFVYVYANKNFPSNQDAVIDYTSIMPGVDLFAIKDNKHEFDDEEFDKAFYLVMSDERFKPTKMDKQ